MGRPDIKTADKPATSYGTCCSLRSSCMQLPPRHYTTAVPGSKHLQSKQAGMHHMQVHVYSTSSHMINAPAAKACRQAAHALPSTRPAGSRAKAECLTFQNSRETATLAQVVGRQRDIVGHCPACPQQDHGCDHCGWMSHPAKA